MRRLLILLVLAPLAVGAGDFVTNPASTLPGPKSDQRALPAGSDPNKFLRASDYNALRDGLFDARAWIYAPTFTNITASGNVSAANVNASGSVTGNGSSVSVTATGSTTARTLAARAGDVKNVLDFGADPTGAVVSTAAFNALDAALALITDRPVRVVIPAGRYKVNPKETTVPFGSSQARLFGLYSNGSSVEGPGEIVIDSSIDYTAGYSAGDEKYWSVVLVAADDCTVEGIGFNGNGTHTARGYDPAGVNVRWQLVGSFGTVGAHRRGNRVLRNRGTDFGGQAVAFQYQDDAVIASNRFDHHSGMGVSVGERVIIEGNQSSDCYDAPYYVNGNVNGARIYANLINGTSNGSGIDVVGSSDVDVFANRIQGAAGSGVWIHYSAQQLVGSSNVRVRSNSFIGNARYTSVPVVAEIVLGRTDASQGVSEAAGVVISDNDFVIDGSLSGSADRTVIVGYGASRVEIRRNRLSGVANSTNVVFHIKEATDSVQILDNDWNGSATPQVVVTDATPARFVVSRNHLIGEEAETGSDGPLYVNGSAVLNGGVSLSGDATNGATVQVSASASNVGIAFQSNKLADSVGTDFIFNSPVTRTAGALAGWRNNGTVVSTVDPSGGIRPGQLNVGGVTNSAHLYSGSGVPSNTYGANGDFYFRTDTPTVANQRLYVKAAGSWTGLL